MELRSHSSVSCHLVAIHGTPTQDERYVTQIYYRCIYTTRLKLRPPKHDADILLIRPECDL
jgi:hypothetical protein